MKGTRNKSLILLANVMVIAILSLILLGPATAFAQEGGNQAPVANDDAYSVDKNAVLTIVAPGVLNNDTDLDGNMLVANLQYSVIHGNLTWAGDGSFNYTPDLDFEGIDTFTYFANDGIVDSLNPATVTIDVGNQAPVANDDAYSVDKNAILSIVAPGVLNNDTDLDGNMLVANLQYSVIHGNLTWAGDGSFNYTPNLDFEGIDTFTYFANDGIVDSLNPATVTIDVGNQEPGPNGEPARGQIPPGQMVRRGLSGPIEGIGTDAGQGTEMLFLLIRTNFGIVKVYVPASLGLMTSDFDGDPPPRVAVKLAKMPGGASGFAPGQSQNTDSTGEEPYRVEVAERIKVIPGQASRSHEWGAEEIAIVQGEGSGKQFKGFEQTYRIISRLEALIGQAKDAGDEGFTKRLEQRLEKQKEKQQRLLEKAQEHASDKANKGKGNENRGKGRNK